MAVRLDDFLKAHNFTADPFASTSAEEEIERLPRFFVEGSWFDWLIGNPRAPQSVVVFAPPGYGKTSHRLEVARRVSTDGSGVALVVAFDDLYALVEHDPPLLRHHIELIRRQTLRALDRELRRRESALQRLAVDALLYAQLHALWRFYTPLSLAGRPWPEHADFFVEALRNEVFEPKEILRQLSTIAGQAGFASVYLLLDGFDELTELRHNPERLLALLGPLIDAPGLLQSCGFAFKFFLPSLIADPLHERKVGRLDRIPYRTLSWTEDDLCTILSRRLSVYSRLSPATISAHVETFQELCDDTVIMNIDRLLARAANGSPRTLLNLARDILRCHCDYAERPDERILLPTIRSVISAEPDAVAPPIPTLPATVVSGEAIRNNIPLLYLDARGDIWLGDQLLEANLPPRLMAALRYLWENRERMVGYEELEKALYSHDYEERGDPRSSREKLIRRLREALEPGQPTSRTYIDSKTGLGYVLRNIREPLMLT